MITSESPAIQSRIGSSGVNVAFCGFSGSAAGGVSSPAGVVGVPVPGPATGGASVPSTGGVGGSTISVSMVACSRPMALSTQARGRSIRSAMLTSRSGPATASATSRCVPSGWLYTDL